MKLLKTAVILVDEGVQDEEYIYPKYRCLEAGLNVETATPDIIIDGKPANKTVKGKYGIPIVGTCNFADLSKMFDKFNVVVVIVPGGWQAPELMRQDQRILHFLREADDRDIIIGAICHGPLVLISSGLVKGRRMTCYKGMKDDLVNAGAEYIDAPVVVDGSFVSSPHYRDNPSFMRAILVKVAER